uniref:Type II/III secretion system secretin-like domain-containing protein n=1 Tax=Fervidobacterium nodosum TaxID=2424 RepID=A0A7C5U8M9_9BACT
MVSVSKKIFIFIIIFTILLAIITSKAFSEEISFFNTNIKEVLNTLSLEYGKPIIYESNIAGSITLTISSDNLTFEQLLDLIVMPFNYYWVKLENVYFVGIANSTSPAFINVSSFYEVPLKFVNVERIYEMIPKHFQDYIVKVNNSKNLLVYAPASIASQIANFVTKIDKPIESKVVEVKIIDVSESYLNAYINDISSGNALSYFPNMLQIPLSGMFLNVLYSNSKSNDENFQILYDGSFSIMNGSSMKVTTQKNITLTKYVDGKLTTNPHTMSIEVSVSPKYLFKVCFVDLNVQISGIPSSNEVNFDSKGASLQSTVKLEYGKSYIISSVSYDRAIQKEGGFAILKDLPFIGPFFKRYYFETEKRYIIFLITVEG